MVTTPHYDLDIDTTLGGSSASDYVIPSQKAIKAYVDNNSGSTVDQTYDPTSQAAQSGVAIAGANFLSNSATGSHSISVDGSATNQNWAINIGYLSQSLGANSVSLGANAQSTKQETVAIGVGTKARSQGAVCVGYASDCASSISYPTAIGCYSNVTANYGLAIGYVAKTTADATIQLGTGTNSTANSLQVWTYQLLDKSTGLIPDARISTNIARTSDIPDVSNFVTNSSLATTLSSYATQAWVTSQGYTSNVGTVTSVNNTQPDANGNVTIQTGGTVDQTYDGTSANAQSGVAIAGAKFVQNTATATNSLTILGTTNNRNNSILIGYGTTAGSTNSTVIGNTAVSGGSYATALGYYARANDQYTTAIGNNSYANYQDVTAVGHSSQATAAGTLAVGSNSKATAQRATSIGYSSQATQYQATALGYEAKATANSALQIGTGTNSTANTLQVGSYTLLNTSTGLIPDARISSNIARTSAIPDISTKQDILISGTNIKTINNESVLGSGNLSLANTDLSNLSATGKKVIDGQWVQSYLDLVTSAITLNANYSNAWDISSYLPNDNHIYEVYVSAFGITTATSGSLLDVRVGSSILKANNTTNSATAFVLRSSVRSNANRQVSNTIVIPVGTDRQLTVMSYGTGTLNTLRLLAYRRVGTNT